MVEIIMIIIRVVIEMVVGLRAMLIMPLPLRLLLLLGWLSSVCLLCLLAVVAGLACLALIVVLPATDLLCLSAGRGLAWLA